MAPIPSRRRPQLSVPLTDRFPKVMVPVAGKPFLLHLLKLLQRQGISDVVLCIGYLGQYVRDILGEGEGLGIRIRYSEEREQLLGTGGALKQAQALLADHFFVLNGDTYLPVDYGGRMRISCRWHIGFLRPRVRKGIVFLHR